MDEPKSTWFTRQQVDQILSIAIDQGLFKPEMRRLLLEGLPMGLRASLRTHSIPRDQIHSDLLTLNELVDQNGQSPLLTWLRNASKLVQTPIAANSLAQLADAVSPGSVPNTLTIAHFSDPERADLAVCSTDAHGTPSPLNERILTSRGHAPGTLAAASDELVGKGWTYLDGPEPVLAITTIGSGSTEDLLSSNLTAALENLPYSIRSIWIPLLGTGAGGLTNTQAIELTVAAIQKTRLLERMSIEYSLDLRTVSVRLETLLTDLAGGSEASIHWPEEAGSSAPSTKARKRPSNKTRQNQAPIPGVGVAAKPKAVKTAQSQSPEPKAPPKPASPAQVEHPPAALDLYIQGKTRRLMRGDMMLVEISDPPLPDWTTPQFGADRAATLYTARDQLIHGWDRPDILRFGKRLCDMLFPDLDATTIAIFDAVNRVVLHLDGTAVQVPWEYLVIGEMFLLERHISVVRHVAHANSRSTVIAEWHPIALVSANPQGDAFDPFVEGDSRKKINASLATKVALDLTQANRDTLRQIPLMDSVRVLHFLGHGTPQGLIVLDTARGYDEVAAGDVAQIIQKTPSIELVILSACDAGSATNIPGYGMTGVALEIARVTGVPVVAMQLEVPQQINLDFAVAFYEALRTVEGDIEKAVHIARGTTRKMGMHFGIPVLYADTHARPTPPTVPQHTYQTVVRVNFDTVQPAFQSALKALPEAIATEVLDALKDKQVFEPNPQTLTDVAQELQRHAVPPKVVEKVRQKVREQIWAPPRITQAARITHRSRSLDITTDHVKVIVKQVGERFVCQPNLIRRILGELAAGRHVMLTGPVGTGKTTLARSITTALRYSPRLYTAHAEWSAFEVVGGFWPHYSPDATTHQITEEMRFRPGCFVETMLENWRVDDTTWVPSDRPAWLIIDELNRADMDRAMGELFTALSSNWVRVPRIAALNEPATVELPIPDDFRVLATMNTMDRHYLFRLSDALRRRFAFIEVPVVTPDLYAREWAILGGDGEPPAAEDHVRAFVYAVRAVYPVGTALLKAALGFVRKTAGWGVSVAEQVDQALLGSVVPILEEAPVDVLDTILHSLNADDTNRPWAAVLQALQRLRDLADA